MKIIEFLKNPIKILRNKYYADLFRSDRFIEIAKTDLRRAIDLRWQAHKGYSFPWDNPVDLNEKIMWLEACTDTTLWTKYSDKYEVRDYLRSLGLEQYR